MERDEATGGTGVEPDDLVGTWTATSFVHTSVASPAVSADLVADDGAVSTFVLGSDGTYTWTFVSDVEPLEDEAGTYTVSGSLMTLIPTDGPLETIVIFKDGNTLTMTLDDTYDFDGDQFEENAVLVITLTRTDATDPTDPNSPIDPPDPTGVEPADLAGAWTATAIVFTSVADPTLSVDEAANGATMSLTMTADGTYAWTFVFPGEPTENETGTYTVFGDTLTVTPTNGPQETMGVSRDGDTMTLTLDDFHDFDGDQVEEPATLVITLTR